MRASKSESSPCHRIFVPEYTQELRLELQGCVSSVSPGCPVRVTVGATTLPRNFQRVLTCTGLAPSCHLLLSSPPWGRWLQVTFESLAEPHVTVGFTAKAVFTGGLHGRGVGRGGRALSTSPRALGFLPVEPLVFLTVCRPWSVTIHHLIQNNPNQTYDTSAIQLSQSAVHRDLGRSSRVDSGPFCLLNYPVLREDTDVVSVHFQPLNGAFVLVHSSMPSVMQLRLDTGMDSGGSFIIVLRTNKVSSGSPLKQSTAAGSLGLAQGTG